MTAQTSETAAVVRDSAETSAPVDDPERSEGYNLVVLMLQQVVLRTGWIFKTESVIMPAVLDAIAGAGWMRGFLPVLNRFGQSVPPLVYAKRLRATPLKKRTLAITSASMAAPFLILSAIWWGMESHRPAWLPWLFLLLYGIFFSATGLNQLAYGTLQGKVIRPHRRGRLMGVAGIVGSITAVTAALIWLRPWLALPHQHGFRYVFLFNGLAFLAAGVVALFCVETRDSHATPPTRKLREHFLDAWHVYRCDRKFRRAANVAMLFTSSLLLLPHYQWLGREVLGTTNADLIPWVIAQNISVGIYSSALGVIADRFGTRLAVRYGVMLTAIAPLVALFLASPFVADGGRWYWITFVCLGLFPVTMKALHNHTLELAPPEEHPRYLSTMTLCFAVPFVWSPLFGWLIDILPYQLPFLLVTGLVSAGGILTFRMVEPRHELDAEDDAPA